MTEIVDESMMHMQNIEIKYEDELDNPNKNNKDDKKNKLYNTSDDDECIFHQKKKQEINLKTPSKMNEKKSLSPKDKTNYHMKNILTESQRKYAEKLELEYEQLKQKRRMQMQSNDNDRDDNSEIGRDSQLSRSYSSTTSDEDYSNSLDNKIRRGRRLIEEYGEDDVDKLIGDQDNNNMLSKRNQRYNKRQQLRKQRSYSPNEDYDSSSEYNIRQYKKSSKRGQHRVQTRHKRRASDDSFMNEIQYERTKRSKKKTNNKYNMEELGFKKQEDQLISDAIDFANDKLKYKSNSKHTQKIDHKDIHEIKSVEKHQKSSHHQSSSHNAVVGDSKKNNNNSNGQTNLLGDTNTILQQTQQQIPQITANLLQQQLQLQNLAQNFQIQQYQTQIQQLPFLLQQQQQQQQQQVQQQPPPPPPQPQPQPQIQYQQQQQRQQPQRNQTIQLNTPAILQTYQNQILLALEKRNQELLQLAGLKKEEHQTPKKEENKKNSSHKNHRKRRNEFTQDLPNARNPEGDESYYIDGRRRYNTRKKFKNYAESPLISCLNIDLENIKQLNISKETIQNNLIDMKINKYKKKEERQIEQEFEESQKQFFKQQVQQNILLNQMINKYHIDNTNILDINQPYQQDVIQIENDPQFINNNNNNNNFANNQQQQQQQEVIQIDNDEFPQNQQQSNLQNNISNQNNNFQIQKDISNNNNCIDLQNLNNNNNNDNPIHIIDETQTNNDNNNHNNINNNNSDNNLNENNHHIIQQEISSEEDEQRQIQRLDVLPREGHFNLGDKPVAITSSRIHDNNIYLEITWEKRKNNITPTPSYFNTNEIKKYDIHFLLNYYENKIIKTYNNRKENNSNNNNNNDNNTNTNNKELKQVNSKNQQIDQDQVVKQKDRLIKENDRLFRISDQNQEQQQKQQSLESKNKQGNQFSTPKKQINNICNSESNTILNNKKISRNNNIIDLDNLSDEKNNQNNISNDEDNGNTYLQQLKSKKIISIQGSLNSLEYNIQDPYRHYIEEEGLIPELVQQDLIQKLNF